MRIIHNKINLAISEMEEITSKGQPFAKRNKERRIREVLRRMRGEQEVPPGFREVFFYLRMYGISTLHRIWKAITGRN